jgi:methylmalonyl-CoA mutase
MVDRYASKNKIRVVTAASLFDGHDAAINIMRRILQSGGAEVIHLGHNRTARDVALAAIQEDAAAVAISSYQGGHMEYFRYVRRLLDENGGSHIKIFGGGGGVIVPVEIQALEQDGIERIYSPEDGRRLGLEGLIDDMLMRSDTDPLAIAPPDPDAVRAGDQAALARAITAAEAAVAGIEGGAARALEALRASPVGAIPSLGITGTGGSGKSSLTDELLRRWLLDRPESRVAVLSIDPTRRRTGGALLGDRIRMNAIDPSRVFMRSLATREKKGELSAAIRDAVHLCRVAGYDLVIVETSGIGQGDADIATVTDVSLYVMTPEYGAASQLEKIDMLDYADLIAINKFEKRGALDALRDVRKQVARNRRAFTVDPESMPVYGTIASRFADEGVNALYHGLLRVLRERTGQPYPSTMPQPPRVHGPPVGAIVPTERERYLREVAATVRGWHQKANQEAEKARKVQSLAVALGAVAGTDAEAAVAGAHARASADLAPETRDIVDGWSAKVAEWSGDELVYVVRGREVRQPLVTESLSHQSIPRVALPRTDDHATVVRFSMLENLPGAFPFTAGVFPLKREGEDPKRMFAGEGGPAQTNERFHFLCRGERAHRLSTAFDSVTLYGEDPAERPDIYGKIGESGVSVPHLDDMKILYGGFHLCAPTTSVSMTINGPAPILLAMFFNTAIDQEVDRFEAANGRPPTEDERAAIADRTVRTVRGTVQADILKEDQAQNTCIFSTEFALRMMGDVQSWFVENDVRNFYSVSISGYHIAEAGANPITQLAFTLANGLTLVEYYRSRGMHIDAFGDNLSFFFSNGLDPEYAVIGRVARRIWAIVMREMYGAGDRAQRLKYHIQTSGRSLHAREIHFNDIRTTLQAFLALADNCNSLHTNAYDEAVTTPTPQSVRQAMAIQLILAREFGLFKIENCLQGSYAIERLTDLVEEAVLQEFERIDDRGGVLGAMERQYQRSKIQDESLYYEHKKHDGSLPIVGINTFVDTTRDENLLEASELRRASTADKDAQIESVRRFQAKHADEAAPALRRLQAVALSGGNLFGELMRTVRVATLGQITHALYQVGGEYRRNL